eukprot:m51a1_g14620 putative 26s proteasome non-atpase regulatory subunit 6 (397) ;mRNA; f:1224023-1225576
MEVEWVEEGASTAERVPDMATVQQRFVLAAPAEVFSDAERQAAREALMARVREQKQAPLYAALCEQFGWARDEALYAQLAKDNADTLKQLDDKIKDAEENLGETEIREALLAKANFFCRTGDKQRALDAFAATEAKTVALGQRLDLIFTQIRLGFFHADPSLVSRSIERADALLEAGGDWDRRNRLKVYRGSRALFGRRDFAEAAEQLLGALSTFTCYEMFDYARFTKVAAVSALPGLPRSEMRSKIVEAPETAAAGVSGHPAVELANALARCDYGSVLGALLRTGEEMRRDWLLAPHADYVCREVRVRAYAQLLESYRSVQLASMARAFGVSAEFMDHELARFIALGRLHCSIDRVGGVVDTNRPDSRSAMYQSMIRHGDALQARVQKLARLVVV